MAVENFHGESLERFLPVEFVSGKYRELGIEKPPEREGEIFARAAARRKLRHCPCSDMFGERICSTVARPRMSRDFLAPQGIRGDDFHAVQRSGREVSGFGEKNGYEIAILFRIVYNAGSFPLRKQCRGRRNRPPNLLEAADMFTIVKREEMSDGNVILNEIEAPLIAKKAKPGQFVILKAGEDGERVPLTMAETDPERGTITVIYMVVGKSTALFRDLREGEGYTDVIGPLGKATHIEKVGNVVCVGGGTGIAVLHPITRALKEAGNHVTAIVGARSKDLLILEDRMRDASHELIVCTDDGSHGRKGFVTEALKEVLEAKDVQEAFAIGPVPMMKFVSKMTAEYNVPTQVSLNPIMVDGTGMCGGCRVSVGGETKFACVDGPEFDGHKVDFDELMNRLQAYCDAEKRCFNDYCVIEEA